MHAHSTTLSTESVRIDDAVRFVSEELLPSVTVLDGCLGLSLLVDRPAGQCIVTSAWEDAAALRASGERRHFLEFDDDEHLFVAPPLLEEWEIAVLHRARRSRPGAWARVAWMRGDPSDADRQVDVYRMLAVPVLDEIDGFCSASLLLDRRGGRAVSCVTYESRTALDRGREQAARMRREAVALTGVEVQRSTDMELMLAHLRVPETV